MVECEYESHEVAEMRALSALAGTFPRGTEERHEPLRSMCVIHELKALLPGARILTEADMRERGVKPTKLGLPDAQPKDKPGTLGDEDGPIQTTMIAPEGTDSLFRIPEKARRRLGMVDSDNTATRAYARTDDPSTSHAAAMSLTEEVLRDSQRGVLDCFRRFGAMCDTEFLSCYRRHQEEYAWPKQSDSGLRSRRDELVDGGLMKDSGEKAPLLSGRQSIVWEVAAA